MADLKTIELFGKKIPIQAILIIALAVVGIALLSQAILSTSSMNAQFLDGPSKQAIADLKVSVNGGTYTTNAQGIITIRGFYHETLTIKVDDPEFELFQRTVLLESDQNAKFSLLPAISDENALVTFSSRNGLALPAGLSIAVKAYCTKNQTIIEQTTTNQKALIVRPVNCGRLLISATVAGFEPVSGVEVEKVRNILLTALPLQPPAKGNMTVQVIDDDTRQTISKGFTIYLRTAFRNELISKAVLNNSQARMDGIVVGSYRVSASDGNQYVMVSPIDVNVKDGVTTPIVIHVSSKPKSVISVRVVDEDQKAVLGARIVVKDRLQKEILAETVSTNESQALALSQSGPLVLQVNAPNYAWSIKPITVKEGNDNSFVVTLEKCSVAKKNCGNLHVQVVNEEGVPLPDVRVALFNSQVESLAILEPQYTDVNGQTTIRTIPSGDYFIRASIDDTWNVESPSFAFDAATDQEQRIVLPIGHQNLVVNVQKSDGESISGASVKVNIEGFTSCPLRESCSKSTNDGGSVDFELSRSQRFNVRVEKDGYNPYQTVSFSANQSKTMELTLTLQPNVENEIVPDPTHNHDVIVRLKSVTDSSGHPTRLLSRGRSYKALLEVQFPYSGQHKVFVRTGSTNQSTSDYLTIDQTNVSGFTVVQTNSEYHPPQGEEADRAHPQGEALSKWSEVTWTNHEAITTQVEVTIHVSADTLPNTELPFYYRAQSENDNQQVTRDPIDPVIGNAVTSLNRNALYANSYQELFHEGQASPDDTGLGYCQEDWCLVEKRVYVNEAIQMGFEPFTIVPDLTNQVEWTIVNNTTQTISDLNIELLNGTPEPLNGYRITQFTVNTNSGSFRSNELGLFHQHLVVPFVESGEKVEIKAQFQAGKPLDAALTLNVKKPGKVLFDNQTYFQTNLAQFLQIENDPENLPLLKRSELAIHVIDQAGSDAENAIVSIQINNQGTLYTTSDESGNAVLPVPVLPTESILIIRAQKPTYLPAEKTLSVTERVLNANPSPISVTLDQLSQRDQTISLSIENLSGQNFLLTGLDNTVLKHGILDEPILNASLIPPIGNTFLSAGEKKSFDLPFQLIEGMKFKADKQVSGGLIMDWTDANLRQTYRLTIPYTVDVKVGHSLSAEDCLRIDDQNFTATTIEGIAQKTITLTNKCYAGGKAIPVQNVEARLNWNSDILGNVLVGIDRNGETTENEVMQPDYVVLLPQLKANESVKLKISFIPLNGRIGKKAFFSVGFNAQAIQETGRKEVGMDEIVNAEVFIANLEQCLRFTPDAFKGMEIQPGEDRGTFKFSTKDCGPIDIDIRLCAEKDNENCSGGTEGGIELSKKEFKNVNQDEEKVEVSRWPEDRAAQIPGLYGITIQVKTPNSDWKKVGEYPVTVHPQVDRLEENGPIYNFFFLDRYKATLTDENTRDTIRLFNTKVNENVETEACLKDWQKASARPDFMGLTKSAAVSQVAGKLAMGLAVGIFKGSFSAGAGAAGFASSASMISSISERTAEGGFVQTVGSGLESQISVGGKAWDGLAQGGLGIESNTGQAVFNGVAGLGLGIGFSVLGTLAGGWVSSALGGGVYAQATGMVVSTAINIVGMGLTSLILGGAFVIPVLGLILALVMLIFQLAILFLSQPPACIPITMNLTDYIINLSGSSGTDSGGNKLIPPDANAVFTDQKDINAQWQLDITDIENNGQLSPQQNVGIILTRTGELRDNPTYTVLSVQATEHYHGDNANHIDFKSKADCKGEDKMGFNDVPCDRVNVLRTEKFHLRIKTKEVLGQFIQPQVGELACISGSRIGTTGAGALPKLKLDWSWNDQKGIQWYTCDASNPNASYCDATQFTIMVFKRMHEIDRALALNDYLTGVCPREQNEQAERTYATISMPFDANQQLRPGDTNADLNSVFVSTQDVNTNTQQGLFIGIGQAGVSKLDRKIVNRKEVYEIVAINQSAQVANFSYLVDIQDPTFTSYGTCDFGAISLQPLETKVLDCNQSINLESRFYIARGKTTATPDNNNQIIDTALTMGFYKMAQDPSYASGESDCDIPRTTEKYLGKSGLTEFIKGIQYRGTEAAPTKIKLLELAHFDAYLQKDSYPRTFLADFYQTYQNKILDAPEWYNGPTGLSNFIKNAKILFTQKYSSDTRIMGPGKYHIEINIKYGNSWKMRPDLDQNLPIVIVTFYPIDDVVKDSPLYYIPIDGKVGIKNDKTLRFLYGTDFNNESETFSIQNGPDRAQTYELDRNSKALQNVNVSYDRSFGGLNAQAEKRGNLLSIQRSNDGWDWKVSPSLATPLIMRVNEPNPKSDIDAYYQILEDQQIVQPNETLMLWNGMGQCLGFDGQSMASGINEKADRKISSELDKGFSVIPRGYSFEWTKATRTGDAWLKTILYSPLGHQYTVQGLSKNVQLLTPTNQKSGQSVVLEGIQGMYNNYQGLSTDQTPDSLQSLFDLVEKGQVCVTRTENGEEYWWNEQALYDQAGQGTSVNTIENSLVGGETCIG